MLFSVLFTKTWSFPVYGCSSAQQAAHLHAEDLILLIVVIKMQSPYGEPKLGNKSKSRRDMEREEGEKGTSDLSTTLAQKT